MTIQAVIFDIGNVLIEWQPERFYDAVIGKERRRAFFDTLDLHAMNDDVDRGAPFRERIYAEAENHPAWRDEIRMWHDRWSDMATPAIDHSVRLLRALRARGVPVLPGYTPGVRVSPGSRSTTVARLPGCSGVTRAWPEAGKAWPG